jgi:hypothetical protein
MPQTPKAEDADGKTPLQSAVQCNRHQVLELMSDLANFEAHEKFDTVIMTAGGAVDKVANLE